MLVKIKILSQNSKVDGKKYIIYIDKTQIKFIFDFMNHLMQVLEIQVHQQIQVFQQQFRIPKRESIQILSQSIQYTIKIITCKNNQFIPLVNKSTTNNNNMAIQQQNSISSQEIDSFDGYDEQLNNLRKKSIIKKQILSDNVKQIKKQTKKIKHIQQDEWKTESSDSSNQPLQKKIRQKKQFKNFFINKQKGNEQKPMISLEDFIGGQVNYYFSDKNYFKDQFLQRICNLNKDQYMQIDLLLTFPKIKKVVTDINKLIYFLQIYQTKNKNYELDETSTRIRKKINVNSQNI